jgi:spermidine/putrescine transport system substrate-binding protein
MEKNELIDLMGEGRLKRRDLLKGLAAFGIGVSILPLLPGRARAAEQATLFTWEGYEVPELHQEYIKKHGAGPSFPIFADEDEAFQKMRAGFTPDLAHPCSYNVPRWRDAGLLQPIDTSRLSRWGDVISSLKTIAGTQKDGKQWFIPFDWGNTSILYRTDLVDLKEESWGLMWDERYKGRLATFGSIDETVVYGRQSLEHERGRSGQGQGAAAKATPTVALLCRGRSGHRTGYGLGRNRRGLDLE